MPSKKSSNIDPVKLAQYTKLVATNPAVQLKGDTVPYTSHNGHMFSNFNPDGTLGLRLPADEIEPFLKKYKSKRVEAYGVIRKEYVVVPDTLLKKTAELKPYFDLSFKYVGSLKPKPGTKK